MRHALLTTVHSDAHSWNLIYMERLLREQSFCVENLGVCTPPELVAGRLRFGRPSLVVVSSVNGHGYLEGLRLIEELAPVREAVPVVIGGKLSTTPHLDAGFAQALHDAGYDGVFPAQEGMTGFLAFLKTLRVPARAAS